MLKFLIERHNAPTAKNVFYPSSLFDAESSNLLNGHILAVGRARLDFLASLLNSGKDGLVWELLFSVNLCGLILEGHLIGIDAVELLEDALNSAGAATAAHGHVELVGVSGHVEEYIW